MKKFMKVCAIMALALVTTGFCMILTAGMVKGPSIAAQVRDFLRERREGTYGTPDTRECFSAADIRDLDIEAGAFQVQIVESEDENFYVSTQAAHSCESYVADGTLYIKGPRKPMQTMETILILAVPEGASFEKVELSMGAGQIIGGSMLSADKMDIELGAGEIILSGLRVGELEAQVGMGSLSLEGDILKEGIVECAMGSVEMTLAGAEKDFNYNVEAGAGTVEIDGEIMSVMAAERGIDNDAPKNLSIECAMGSIGIHFAD